MANWLSVMWKSGAAALGSALARLAASGTRAISAVDSVSGLPSAVS